MTRENLLFVGLFLIVLAFLAVGCSSRLGGDLRAITFEHLEEIRDQKQNALMASLENIMEKARGAKHDKFLNQAFLWLSNDRIDRRSQNVGSVAIRELIESLERHYVEQYGDFYDI